MAEPLIEGSQLNVPVIRLSPGQALPPHLHGASDLMLFALEGAGVLGTDDGPVEFAAGSVAWYAGDEELRVSNKGQSVSPFWRFSLRPSRHARRRNPWRTSASEGRV